MSDLVLTILAAWLVFAVLATAACALVTRGGRDEDGRRIRRNLRRRDRSDVPCVPQPPASVR